MSKLVIVESPAKAKTIQKYLGEGYDVVASMGHVRDLPKSKLGIDIEHGFRPDYVEIKGKEDLVQTLKKKAMRFIWPPTRIGKEKRFRGILPICLGWIWIRPTASLSMRLPNQAFSRVWLRRVGWIWIW